VGDVYESGAEPYLVRADHVHGREDTWEDYGNAMLQPGLIFPVTSSASDPRLLPCDGGWYNQYQHPKLYSVIGNSFTPVSGIPNPGTGAGAYNSALHFAVPLLGVWEGDVITWDYLATKWVILADLVA
jgi:hypothetical protein